MQKITLLTFGIVTTIFTVTNAQAAIMPDRLNLTIPYQELQAQSQTVTKRPIAPKKYRIKYPNSPGFKLEQSAKDKVDCQRVVNTADRDRSSSGGFSMSTSVSSIGNPIVGKCN